MIELTAADYVAELKRFRATGHVWLAADEMPADVDVPPAWRALLAAPDDLLADRLVQMWAGIIDRLPAVAQFFRDKLARPAVFRNDGGDVVLLYPYTVEHDDLNFFIGRAPLRERWPDDAPPWTALPEALRRFHQTVHDGWTFFPANSMGPLPLADQAALAGKLDLTPVEIRKLGVNRISCAPCFITAAVTGCASIRVKRPAVATWPGGYGGTSVRPSLAVDFWAVMNAWFEMFVEEADKR